MNSFPEIDLKSSCGSNVSMFSSGVPNNDQHTTESTASGNKVVPSYESAVSDILDVFPTGEVTKAQSGDFLTSDNQMLHLLEVCSKAPTKNGNGSYIPETRHDYDSAFGSGDIFRSLIGQTESDRASNATEGKKQCAKEHSASGESYDAKQNLNERSDLNEEFDPTLVWKAEDAFSEGISGKVDRLIDDRNGLACESSAEDELFKVFMEDTLSDDESSPSQKSSKPSSISDSCSIPKSAQAGSVEILSTVAHLNDQPGFNLVDPTSEPMPRSTLQNLQHKTSETSDSDLYSSKRFDILSDHTVDKTVTEIPEVSGFPSTSSLDTISNSFPSGEYAASHIHKDSHDPSLSVNKNITILNTNKLECSSQIVDRQQHCSPGGTDSLLDLICETTAPVRKHQPGLVSPEPGQLMLVNLDSKQLVSDTFHSEQLVSDNSGPELLQTSESKQLMSEQLMSDSLGPIQLTPDTCESKQLISVNPGPEQLISDNPEPEQLISDTSGSETLMSGNSELEQFMPVSHELLQLVPCSLEPKQLLSDTPESKERVSDNVGPEQLIPHSHEPLDLMLCSPEPKQLLSDTSESKQLVSENFGLEQLMSDSSGLGQVWAGVSEPDQLALDSDLPEQLSEDFTEPTQLVPKSPEHGQLLLDTTENEQLLSDPVQFVSEHGNDNSISRVGDDNFTDLSSSILGSTTMSGELSTTFAMDSNTTHSLTSSAECLSDVSMVETTIPNENESNVQSVETYSDIEDIYQEQSIYDLYKSGSDEDIPESLRFLSNDTNHEQYHVEETSHSAMGNSGDDATVRQLENTNERCVSDLQQLVSETDGPVDKLGVSEKESGEHFESENSAEKRFYCNANLKHVRDKTTDEGYIDSETTDTGVKECTHLCEPKTETESHELNTNQPIEQGTDVVQDKPADSIVHNPSVRKLRRNSSRLDILSKSRPIEAVEITPLPAFTEQFSKRIHEKLTREGLYDISKPVSVSASLPVNENDNIDSATLHDDCAGDIPFPDEKEQAIGGASCLGSQIPTEENHQTPSKPMGSKDKVHNNSDEEQCIFDRTRFCFESNIGVQQGAYTSRAYFEKRTVYDGKEAQRLRSESPHPRESSIYDSYPAYDTDDDSSEKRLSLTYMERKLKTANRMRIIERICQFTSSNKTETKDRRPLKIFRGNPIC